MRTREPGKIPPVIAEIFGDIRKLRIILLVMVASFCDISVNAAWAAEVAIPNFWDPRERLARPDLSTLPRLRFLTTTDFPPFNFIDREKRLTGFNVELARAICAELGVLPRCQIQALPWDELADALARGVGDAAIAAVETTAANRAKFEFSRAYLRIPARFVARKSDAIGEPMHQQVLLATTGLIEGSGHQKWFATAFAAARTETFATRQEALAALKAGKIGLVFSDAVSLSYWLQSDDAAGCCQWAGGAYFGEGNFSDSLAIAFPRGQTALADAADYALKELSDKGVFAEIYLRYFPQGLY
jgi:polar amino acid transport system substrate-binding protein